MSTETREGCRAALEALLKLQTERHAHIDQHERNLADLVDVENLRHAHARGSTEAKKNLETIERLRRDEEDIRLRLQHLDDVAIPAANKAVEDARALQRGEAADRIHEVENKLSAVTEAVLKPAIRAAQEAADLSMAADALMRLLGGKPRHQAPISVNDMVRHLLSEHRSRPTIEQCRAKLTSAIATETALKASIHAWKNDVERARKEKKSCISESSAFGMTPRAGRVSAIDNQIEASLSRLKEAEKKLAQFRAQGHVASAQKEMMAAGVEFKQQLDSLGLVDLLDGRDDILDRIGLANISKLVKETP